MVYIVKSKRRSTGEIIISQKYNSRAEAESHANNTKKYWKHIYKNPRVKKI